MVLFTEDSVEQRDTVPEVGGARAGQMNTASDAETLLVGGIPEAAATEVRPRQAVAGCCLDE